MASAQASDGRIQDASQLFVTLAKAQPFGDVNKRTALLTANGLLLAKQSEYMLTVPTDQENVKQFNTLLSDWYLHDNDEIIDWLADWNIHQQE